MSGVCFGNRASTQSVDASAIRIREDDNVFKETWLNLNFCYSAGPLAANAKLFCHATVVKLNNQENAANLMFALGGVASSVNSSPSVRVACK